MAETGQQTRKDTPAGRAGVVDNSDDVLLRLLRRLKAATDPDKIIEFSRQAERVIFHAQSERAPKTGILNHLIKRFRDGQISEINFMDVKHWLESGPEVPAGKWVKHFRSGMLVGDGRQPLSFRVHGSTVEGEEVR